MGDCLDLGVESWLLEVPFASPRQEKRKGIKINSIQRNTLSFPSEDTKNIQTSLYRQPSDVTEQNKGEKKHIPRKGKNCNAQLIRSPYSARR